MARFFLLFVAIGAAGCESCDFSFGPLPVIVDVTPADVDAVVTLCREDDPCQERVTNADTGNSGGPAITDGEALFYVGWQGYVTCRHPRLDVTVQAPGCRTAHVHRDRQNSHGDYVVILPVVLDCGG